MYGRGMTLTRGVFDQASIAGAKDVLRAVTQADFELSGQDDDELAAWCRVPILRP
jgi:hypothetical protein